MTLPGFSFIHFLLLLFFIKKRVNLTPWRHLFLLTRSYPGLPPNELKGLPFKQPPKGFSPPFRNPWHLSTEILGNTRPETAACQQVADSHSKCAKCEHLLQNFSYRKPRSVSENATELFCCATKEHGQRTTLFAIPPLPFVNKDQGFLLQTRLLKGLRCHLLH